MALTVVKETIWDGLDYDPHDGQLLIHNSLIRNRIASCGRRFGKSTVGGHEFVPEAMKTFAMLDYLRDAGKKREFWIGGPDYTDGEKEFRVIYNDMKKLQFPFDRPGTYNNPLSQDMHISCWEGLFQIHVKSAKSEDSWDGEGLAGVELVEAAKLKARMYNKYIRPSLSDVRGWCLMTSTPEGKNWFYEMWQRGQDPDRKDWASWRMPSWKNRHIYPGGRQDDEILSMEADMSAEKFAQEIGADFTDFVGRVFKDFDEEVHVSDLRYDPSLPLYGACDYGWTNPFVWLAIQVDAFDNVYVLDEYRVDHRDINEIGSDLLTWKEGLAVSARRFFPDPAEPGDTAVLEKKLRVRANPDTGGLLKYRLEYIRKYLKLDPASEGHPDEFRKPKLFVNRSCVGNPLGDGGLIREMLDYRYPETKDESKRAQPEEPIDKDNHGPEALGRFYRGYYGSPEAPESRGHARVRKAVMSGGGR